MDAEDYKNYIRMSDSSYGKLLSMRKPFLERQNTNMRICISVDKRLAVVLRYLAIGRYFKDLKYPTIMPPTVLSQAIVQT